MEFEDIKAQLEQKMEAVALSLEVKDIIGTSTIYDGSPDARGRAVKFLDEGYYNKIRVENVIVLTDVDKNEPKSQHEEDKRLQDKVREFASYLVTEIEEIAKEGEFKFELNKLFKELIQFIDLKKEEMNFDSWLRRKLTGKSELYYYVILDDERFAFPHNRIDFSQYCIELIKNNFNVRKNCLQYLKNVVVNIFSTYLFLPDIKILPKLSYSCSPTNICELILALIESGSFDEPQELKSLLLASFNIKHKQFTDAVSTINSKAKARGPFVTELAENFNKRTKRTSRK